MFADLLSSAATAAVERATLVANHVIGSEAEATRRLRPHAGRCIELHLDGWPASWPALPALRFLVTPAGLLEWCGDDAGAPVDLALRVDAAQPAALAARWAAGTRPRIDIDGDAQFATDLNWLIDHLRWDVEDDLARVVGAAPARELSRAGRALHGGLRRVAGALVARWPQGETTTTSGERRGTVPGAR